MNGIGRGARFIGPGELADVAVLIVTYQSGKDIERLIESLRSEAGLHRLRVVVADNDSTDDTLKKLAANSDITVIEVGGNLGYAAGINAASSAAGAAKAWLILNPDLEVKAGCIGALLKRIDEERAAVVVPRILDRLGETYPSLRQEPNLLGALGDALFGSRVASRPSMLSENLYPESYYVQGRTVDWATGAALLIDAETAARVGPWDESFFLYSEETDFFRRVRELGGQAWYEPDAVVLHDQGGSGSSIALEQLRSVNRIRYVRKHHNRLYAALYRGLVVLHALVRSYQPVHRAVLALLISEKKWASLPGAAR